MHTNPDTPPNGWLEREAAIGRSRHELTTPALLLDLPVCAEEGRWEFMVVLSPLRLPQATGSPFNPIALF